MKKLFEGWFDTTLQRVAFAEPIRTRQGEITDFRCQRVNTLFARISRQTRGGRHGQLARKIFRVGQYNELFLPIEVKKESNKPLPVAGFAWTSGQVEAGQLIKADPFQFIYINQAAELIWHTTCARLRQNPRSFMDTAVADDHPLMWDCMAQYKAGQASEVYYRTVTPDGPLRWLLVRAFMSSDATGKPIRHIGTLTTIQVTLN